MTPIRRNFAHLTQAERAAYIAAVQQLDTAKIFGDGVSYWDKQDQIHQATHVHGGASFITWHRELVNRYEELLQEVDATVALHYWDWTVDPRNAPDGQGGTVDLMAAVTMGASNGRVGAPFNGFDNNSVLAGSRDDTNDPTDPPAEISRFVVAGAPGIATDTSIVQSGDAVPIDQQWQTFRGALESNHNTVHGFIGGDIGNGHTAFEDPFVFLLHANVDRLWALWQTQPGYEWRLDPAQVYGIESTDPAITETLEPWDGAAGMRPWAPPENEVVSKTSLHHSVVRPPCYDTNPLTVDLTTPVSGAPITFNAVPEGVTTVRAAVFQIRACTDVTLEITNGPGVNFDTPLGATTVVPYSQDQPVEGRVWISFEGTTAGSSNNGEVTIHCVETDDTWVIPITAQTITRPKAAGVLVLDKSGSMAWNSGIPGMSRLDVLKWAAPQYVNLMDDDDGIGIVAFDSNADPVMSVTTAGPPVFGAGRAAALTAIMNHDENGGGTAIGDGLELGHNTINPAAGYDHKSLVVFTDGQETASKYISEVAGLLNERIFAIGLGRADQLDIAALGDLTSGTDGFVLMTGDLGVDDLFKVNKYFLQVLAGVTNSEIVVDPEGAIAPKQVHRIPFQLSEGEYRTDIVLMTPAPWAIDFALETPDGKVLTEADVAAVPNATFVQAQGVSYYRIALPMLVDGQRVHAGTWHALLRVDEGQYKEYRGTIARDTNSALRSGIPYNLSVYARSAVAMHPSVHQDSYEPGATIGLAARLSQYDLSLRTGAQVRVEVAHAGAPRSTRTLHRVGDGTFGGDFNASEPGVYQLRFLASGTTLGGTPFTREALRTVAVTPGGDNPSPRPTSATATSDDAWERICELVECLMGSGQLKEVMARLGIDPEALIKCLERICRRRPTPQQVSGLTTSTLTDLSNLLSRPDIRRMLNVRSD